MARCGSCGLTVPEDLRLCPKCGSQKRAADRPRAPWIVPALVLAVALLVSLAVLIF